LSLARPGPLGRATHWISQIARHGSGERLPEPWHPRGFVLTRGVVMTMGA